MNNYIDIFTSWRTALIVLKMIIDFPPYHLFLYKIIKAKFYTSTDLSRRYPNIRYLFIWIFFYRRNKTGIVAIVRIFFYTVLASAFKDLFPIAYTVWQVLSSSRLLHLQECNFIPQSLSSPHSYMFFFNLSNY